jgi:uncharacterized protein YoaH (UPF0181 family)
LISSNDQGQELQQMSEQIQKLTAENMSQAELLKTVNATNTELMNEKRGRT